MCFITQPLGAISFQVQGTLPEALGLFERFVTSKGDCSGTDRGGTVEPGSLGGWRSNLEVVAFWLLLAGTLTYSVEMVTGTLKRTTPSVRGDNERVTSSKIEIKRSKARRRTRNVSSLDHNGSRIYGTTRYATKNSNAPPSRSRHLEKKKTSRTYSTTDDSAQLHSW